MLVDPSGRLPGFCTWSIIGSSLVALSAILITVKAIVGLGPLLAAVTAAENPLVIDVASAAVAAFGSALTDVLLLALGAAGAIIVVLALVAYTCGYIQ